MARTELPNGIILPAEYSDDWYDDMTSNLSKLDEVIGSDADKLSAEDVGAAALSNDYTDLDNKPDLNPYDQHLANTEIHVTSADKQKWNDNVSQSYVLRYASTSVTPSSTIAYSVLNNTDNIKAGDSVIDSAGKVFLIASVDTVNETVTVSAVLLTLALDANVMHLTGNESASGDKNFRGLLTTIPNSSLWPAVSNTSDDITLLGRSVVHLEQLSSGRLTDLSSGAWNVVELGTGVFFFRNNIGTDIRYKHLDTGVVSRIPVVSGANRFINDATPNQDNTYNLGSSSLRWRLINGLNPSALSLPDLSAGLDISSYLTPGNTDNSYTPPVNGWIWIRCIGNGAGIVQGDFSINANYVSDNVTDERWVDTNLFVTAGVQATIRLRSITSIKSAKFYPCKGNM